MNAPVIMEMHTNVSFTLSCSTQRVLCDTVFHICSVLTGLPLVIWFVV